MDLLPYVREMGIAGSIIFFLLFLRSEMKRDAVTKQLIDILPIVTAAITSTKASLDTATELMRQRARDDAAARKDQ